MIDAEVILAGKYFLRELVEDITLEDAIDEIAYRASVTIVVTDDFPGIFNGQSVRVQGRQFQGNGMVTLLDGIVWDIDSQNGGVKHLTATVYDRTIYMARSEDEYLFPAGQTATQRLKRYAADWGIQLGSVEETGVTLVKAVYRAQPIYNMVLADLRETVAKGGKMFRPRMIGTTLDLVSLGSNSRVWVLEAVQEIGQRRTLEGAVTQVKVLGQAEDEKRSPVLAVERGDTSLGTLQRVIQDSKITTLSAATSAAREQLAGAQESFTVTAPDINEIRAGDKVMLNSLELLVISVRHRLGTPGEMFLELGSEAYVRRKFYGSI